jgi:beta-lactam-binding protein with PASTA domain
VDITLQDPLVGHLVDGRYLVESRIARGGMATVYRALDRRLDREIALKVMHDHLAVDDGFVSRFVREARAAARLSHPNVVQVFDQGADDKALYLAMEYLPGRTLRDVLTERGALTPRESVSVLEPVLGALGAAHRAGIVHRDVKPENVILTDDGRIKVADFGLAGAITGPISSSVSGELLGTVAYLSPEQVSRGVADARADVYAAGIMLFELLTGKQPFTGDDPLRVAFRHVQEVVPAPTSVSPELPYAFDDVVLRATSRNPDERPANATELLADLHAALAQVPDQELDRRAAEAVTLRMDAAQRMDAAGQAGYRTEAFGSVGLNGAPAAPAAAAGPQPTSVLAVPRRSLVRGTGQLVPRLKVHDDEPLPPGFLGDRTRHVISAIIGVILVTVLIFTGVWWFTSGPGSYTETPDLTGRTVAEARRLLDTEGLSLRENKVFNETIAAGQVVSTDPKVGEDVPKGGTVVLNVSKGPELVEVPTLKGKSQQDAESEIKKAKLKVGDDVTRRFSGSVDEGDVISSSPTAGSKVAPGREVNLVISKGAEPVPLDNVVGKDQDEAKQILEDKGLKVLILTQDFVEGAADPGTVIAQDPVSQGQTVDKGSTVEITVVKLPDGLGFIKDLNGRNFEEAKAELEQDGFKVRRDPFSVGNTVRNQSNRGLTPLGTEVTLFAAF